VSKTEELLGGKNSDWSRKSRLRPYEIRRADHATPLYPQKLALTSPTKCDRLVGIVRSRTKSTEFLLFIIIIIILWDTALKKQYVNYLENNFYSFQQRFHFLQYNNMPNAN
jgi:hypothetical protein